ncbi:conserved hypothetical protein [Candidatus Terasakiella magnetica]|uniref:SiaC family regulatory phosphoprotein domain-containing protein n=1 Tax=Candidatus Terasakiella magnetica TaxID=1867952 RepID=A0A1C3RE35_9PROT|nr:DUF1987 domain-containing protein [Candidatus Terasakiella magnetica]SCA55556.1 conserved hypothetical protein [Candidatus Terasakiella magnetica]
MKVMKTMDSIKRAATERSPEILFNFDENSFLIKGESYPEDVNEFYGPLMDALEKHLSSQESSTLHFQFELIYFNSSTAKILMGIFDLLDESAENGCNVQIKWLFEEDDDNMEELGEEYGEDLEHAEFELVTVSVD